VTWPHREADSSGGRLPRERRERVQWVASLTQSRAIREPTHPVENHLQVVPSLRGMEERFGFDGTPIRVRYRLKKDRR